MNKKSHLESEKEETWEEEFVYEKKFNDEFEELIEELPTPLHETITEQKPYRKTVKIISERDLQYRQAPPPNFSPYFICILHFKGKNYKTRKPLEYSNK